MRRRTNDAVHDAERTGGTAPGDRARRRVAHVVRIAHRGVASRAASWGSRTLVRDEGLRGEKSGVTGPGHCTAPLLRRSRRPNGEERRAL